MLIHSEGWTFYITTWPWPWPRFITPARTCKHSIRETITTIIYTCLESMRSKSRVNRRVHLAVTRSSVDREIFSSGYLWTRRVIQLSMWSQEIKSFTYQMSSGQRDGSVQPQGMHELHRIPKHFFRANEQKTDIKFYLRTLYHFWVNRFHWRILTSIEKRIVQGCLNRFIGRSKQWGHYWRSL